MTNRSRIDRKRPERMALFVLQVRYAHIMKDNEGILWEIMRA